MKTTSNLLLGAAVAATCALAAPNLHAAQAGPDAFGTIVSDAADPSLYGYIDLSTSATATQIMTNGDDNAVTVAFANSQTFNFYGVQTGFVVSANGYLSTDAAETGADWDTDCPVGVPSQGGGGDRLMALHDDLQNVDIYTEYFPTENITVIQWVGQHWSSGGGDGAVDFEILLFHNLHVAVVQVEQDTEGGAASSMGAFSVGLNSGITLDCNNPGYIVPGSTYVAYGALRINELRTEQPNADTDEWFEISAVPGYDPTDIWFVAIGDSTGGGSGVVEEAVDLSTAAVDPTGVGEVFVSIGDTTATIPGLTYTANAGLNFENNDNITWVLLDGFTGAVGDDLDTNDDGLLDSNPWFRAIDFVATLIDDTDPPVGEDWWYTNVTVGPVGGDNPGHIHRCGDIVGPFVVADEDPAAGQDSASGLNICTTCGNGIVEGGEACDGDGAGMGGETATCNANCTTSVCGDGQFNTTAGEQCDDGNGANDDDCPDDVANGGTCQNAVCGDGFQNLNGATVEGCDDGNMANDDDCPDDAANGGTCAVASCGDGFTNSMGTVLEDCDDNGVDSATCNADCSSAMCGDMYINNVAGETCDDGGRSATCDSDCTAVTCGDGIVNMTAGEMCDGDGMGMGGVTATCDMDCTTAMCGDGDINMAAGETCDDTAESLTCDDDCTAAECGDGNMNMTAGEQCDDGNTNNNDGCDANCMTEMGQGGMGGMGMGGMGMGGMGQGGMAQGGGGPGVGGGGTGGNTSSTGSGNNNSDDDATEADTGCSCTAPGDSSAPNGAAPLALLLGLGALARRRRR